jgi:hypothetical protein
MRLKISQYAKMEGVKYRAIWNRIKKGQLKIEKTPTGRIYIIINADINGSGNIMRKAIPNCLTTNGIEGFVVSPVRITPKGYYPYKQVS